MSSHQNPSVLSKSFLKNHLSSVEAGKLFDITNDYVTILCRRRKIRGVFVGRIWYVERESLKEYLEATKLLRERQREELATKLRREHALRTGRLPSLATKLAVFVILASITLGSMPAHAYANPYYFVQDVIILAEGFVSPFEAHPLSTVQLPALGVPRRTMSKLPIEIPLLEEIFARDTATERAVHDARAAVARGITRSTSVAAVTYASIFDSFYDSFTNALAPAFTPPVVLPQTTTTENASAAARETPPSQPADTVSRPTYNTYVQGASPDFVNQSLAQLRANILAEVSNLIALVPRGVGVTPGAVGVAPIVTVIQPVNLIDDLTNLVSISTAALSVTGTATSTFRNGIELSDGCFSIDGTCITSGGGGSGITAFGPSGQTQTGSTITLATSSTAFNGLTASTTITGSGNILTFANALAGLLTVAGGGTGTSSPSGLLYGDGSTALKTVTIGSNLTFSGGTLSASGSGGTQAVSTSTNETAGQVPYWSTTSGSPAKLHSVATTSLAVSYPLQASATLGALLGGLNASLSLAFGTTTFNTWSAHNIFSSLLATNASTTNATTTGSLYLSALSTGGLALDASGKVYSAATSTLSTITGTLSVDKGGTNASVFGSNSPLVSSGASLMATSSKGIFDYLVATTTATSTLPSLTIGTALNLFGTFADALPDLCAGITGSASLCDGDDAIGSASFGQAWEIGGNGFAGFLAPTTTQRVWIGQATSTMLSVFGPAYFGGSATSSFSTTGALTLAVALAPTSGGTGLTSYSTGDILYASAPNVLSRLPIGGENEVLKVSGGVPVWGTFAGGSGGSWSTTTSQTAGVLINYPNNVSDVAAIGASATTSAEYWFDPNTTTAFLSGKVGFATTSPWAQLAINPLATNGSSPAFAIGSSSLTTFVVDNRGAVGVGTSSPVARFAIEIGNTFRNSFLVANEGSSTPAFVINGADNLGAVGVGTSSPVARFAIEIGNTFRDAFLIANEGSTSPAFVVSGANNLGKVGIGTSSPWAKLSIVTESQADETGPALVIATTSFSGWTSGQHPLLYVAATTTGRLDYARVAVGTSTGWGGGGVRDQLTVAGRIYSTWQYWSCDTPGSDRQALVTADTAGALCGGWLFDEDTDGDLFPSSMQQGTSSSVVGSYLDMRAGYTTSGQTNGDGATLRSSGLITSATSSPVFEVWAMASTSVGATTTPVYRMGFRTDAGSGTAGGGVNGDAVAQPLAGVYFEASTSTNWKLVSKNSAGTTTLDTNVSTSTNFRVSKFRIELTTNEATFLVDGNVAGVITNNIPQFSLAPFISVGVVNGNSGNQGFLSPLMRISTVRYWSDDPPGGMKLDDRGGEVLVATTDLDPVQKIGELVYGLAEVMSLRPVSFAYQDSGSHLGFMTRDVARIIPETVEFDAEGLPIGVDDVQMTPVLVRAIQDLNLNLVAIASTTASSTPEAHSFAESFFQALFSRITGWLADAGNGIVEMIATRLRAKEEICVDDQCLTKNDVRALLEIVRGSQPAAAARGAAEGLSEPLPELFPEEPILEAPATSTDAVAEVPAPSETPAPAAEEPAPEMVEPTQEQVIVAEPTPEPSGS